MSTVVRATEISKEYRLGIINHGMLYKDIESWIARKLGRPDRHSQIGAEYLPGGTDRFWALKDITFEIEQGDRIGIIGKNGAGKSTLLKILARITAPTRGRATIRGRVSSLLEVGTGFHPELTGRENVFLNGAILGMKKREITEKMEEIIEFAELQQFIDTPVKRYSSGMYVRLAFSVAAHLDSDILISDEVLAVGDAAFQKKALGKMSDLTSGQGRTLLFVSHNMTSIRQLCNKAFWLDRGLLLEQGPTQDVSAKYEKANYGTLITESGHFERSPTPKKPFYIQWVELQSESHELCVHYNYGDVLNLRVGFGGEAPQGGFTLEWLIFNERGIRISFGAANPMCSFYIGKTDREVQCRLGPLPLTTGTYSFYLSIRIWGYSRWDEWENAASFQIMRCDPYSTGFDVPTGAGGDFIIPQAWSLPK